MKSLIVSKRYAKALFQIAQETKSLNEVLQSFGNICEALKILPEFKKFMANPLFKPEEIEQVVKNVTSNKLVLKSIGLLAKRRRLDLVPFVYEELVHLSDAAEGIKRVLVKTAAELSEFDKRFIEKHLIFFWGGQIIGRFQVAKDLIGGIWMQLGDQVLDMTLRRRFDDLRQNLTHSAN